MRRSPGGSRPWRALCAALLFLLAPALALAQANGKLQIHHLRVGQGDGMLLISPLGQTALFDDGVYTNCTEIKSYLQGLGITVVNYHFASHYHADHIGCIDDLAAIGITIGTAGYDRGSSYSSATYTSYVNTLGSKRVTIAKNQVVTLDAGAANPVLLKCVDLNGAGAYSPSGSDENAKSVVMKVSYGSFDEVIGGDLTGDVGLGNDVESTVGPECGDVEVYKVHHHGSRYSTNDNWLNATTPEVGIIQCGDGNTYGHPTADALARLHAHGVKTYWNETGAGVAPNPTWDKVANGTIVVQADPGSTDSYTVSGPGFSDTYPNGGGPPPPPPPVNTTEYPSSLTMLKGSLATGDVTRLAVSDDSRIGVSAGVTGGNYYTDWYGSVFLAHPPLNLTVNYEGSFTVSRTQTLYLWNWATAAWVQVNSATVGTTDVVKTYTPPSHGPYVSASREVRFRVKGNDRTGTYTSRGDLMSFNYDYTPGTAPQLAATAPLVAAVVAPVEPAWPANERHALSELTRVSAERRAGAVELAWATALEAHVDGFDVYREGDDGALQLVGSEAALELQAEASVYRLRDAAPSARGVYWLGVRSCSGPEALIGPLSAAAVSPPARGLSFAVGPNPACGATEFVITLGEAADVRVDVFDLAGRRVATPFAGRAPAGITRAGWSLAGAGGGRVEPGVYFARMEGGGRTILRRVNVLGD